MRQKFFRFVETLKNNELNNANQYELNQTFNNVLQLQFGCALYRLTVKMSLQFVVEGLIGTKGQPAATSWMCVDTSHGLLVCTVGTATSLNTK